eukprot:TRINITY_DN4123_c0_g2_i1.p1 TRINITY_DN4123_c0_g2~~TRINITY_DN4123_c0_g2_i1.p1  ORF type:complete len:228 (-),score=23.85 TRINITY_DN4123_c0_g2_i1:279-884(-)
MTGSILLCIRHLPCKVLEAELNAAMAELGLAASRYDLYIPKRKMRRGKSNNVGYGFVTCRHTSDAEVFTRAFHGFRFENIQSGKTLSVELAHRSEHSTDFSWWPPESPITIDADMSAFELGRANYHASSTSPNNAEIWWYDQSTTFSASSESSANDEFTWWSAIPDACELPPTRLETGEMNRARLTTVSEHDGSRIVGCFQ